MLRTALAIPVAYAILSATLFAAEKIEQGPLRGLPSPPGAHIARIQALDDNAWLELGPPEADPKWGRARGRSWTSEMPFAPELRGAFLYGEGQHGYTKPDGHYMDDLWFYDINAHRWICCYPGANVKSLQLTLNGDGFETDDAGKLIPVAQQVHGYEMSTYDTDWRQFLMMPNLHTYWERDLPQRKTWLKPPPRNAGPWSFDTATGDWNRRRTKTAGPDSSYGDTFVYLPGRWAAFFLHRNSDVWLYDTQANNWSRSEPQGPPPPFGIDATSCFDTKRERIYIGGGSYPVVPSGQNAFWIYDLNNKTWIDPQPQGAPCQGSGSYPTKNAIMVYDAASDRVLLVFHSHHDDKPERLGVYVYDPNTNAWSGERLAVPDKLGRDRQAKNGFFDPLLSAVFIHTAGDSDDNGTMWVYRYKRAEK